MLFAGEAFPWPVTETGFTAGELQELLSSLFEEEETRASPSSESLGSGDEIRKRKRQISNRESARRSRWRKKRHLENLTNEVYLLKEENRDLKNRLSLVTNQCLFVRGENQRLLTERLSLGTRLCDLQLTLAAMQSHVNMNLTTIGSN